MIRKDAASLEEKVYDELADAILSGADIRNDDVLSKHADWVDILKKQYTFTAENTMDILLQETGKVFTEVLEDAGVYKNTENGRQGFMGFISRVNQEVM